MLEKFRFLVLIFPEVRSTFKLLSAPLASMALLIWDVLAACVLLLFETYPHGLGLDITKYNQTDLESVFDYFTAGGTTLPASLLLKSGKSIRDGIGMVMQDCGVAIAWDAETDKYRFLRAASGD